MQDISTYTYALCLFIVCGNGLSVTFESCMAVRSTYGLSDLRMHSTSKGRVLPTDLHPLSVACKLLHSVIAVVRHEYVPTRACAQPERPLELPGFAALRANDKPDLAIPKKSEDTDMLQRQQEGNGF
jgi:hypothetical protein